VKTSALGLVAAVALLTGCTAAAAAVPDAGAAPVGHAELQLVGSWSGVADDDGDGVLGMDVTSAAADGTSFEGDLTFVIAGTASTEAVHAAMTPNGHLVAEIGADASVEVHIVDPSTLDYCFILYGLDPVYACGRLDRAP
jgi:hypothetical protein